MGDFKLTIPQKGDKKKLLDLSIRNVKQYKLEILKQASRLNPEQRSLKLLKELQELIGLKKIPLHIECFDNSNISGTNPVAACVVFKKAKPIKKEYRKYHIKSVEGADDYASMQEVVRRRYMRLVQEEKPLPDLIFTDGGKGHMEAVRKVVIEELNLDIAIAGLAKNKFHRTNQLLFGFPPKVVDIEITSLLFRFIESIQNEVHRFAITFHRSERSKKQVKSELDLIPGIGPKSKELLLKQFKSVRRIREASFNEWVDLLGKSKAEKLQNYWSDKEKNKDSLFDIK